MYSRGEGIVKSEDWAIAFLFLMHLIYNKSTYSVPVLKYYSSKTVKLLGNDICNIQVIWKRLYKTTSASDSGTIFQLRNIINRKNISKKPKKDVNSHEDFFHLVVDAHVLAAAMEFLGMEDLDEEPNAEVFPPGVWMLHREERRDILLSVCGAIVEQYTDINTFKDTSIQDDLNKRSEDKVLSYAKEVLSFGLFYKEHVDAVHQGDGLRLLSWWYFMMLIFKSTGRTNYIALKHLSF